ncbi:MAG: hypothetical protein ABI665_07405 [Vicinamibacterales bacterium]
MCVALLCARTALAQRAEPSLKQVRDGVYLIQEGDQAGVVYVTPEGILVVDPLSATAGHWLAGELALRFPGRSVRFVVHLSHLFERSAGEIAFPKAATVGHVDFNDHASDTAKAIGNGQVLPPSLAAFDANRDQRLDRVEWSRAAPELSAADTNQDGTITVNEAARLTGRANTRFRNGTTLALGTKRVQIVNPGGSYSTAAVLFPDERVLYIGSNPAFTSTAFVFADVSPHDMLAWLRGVARLPFDTVVTDRGESFSRDRFDSLNQYAEALSSAARSAYLAGRSLAQTSSDPAMQKYAGSPLDSQRSASFNAWFRSFHVSRLELQGAGVAQWMAPNAEFCAEYFNCETGGVIAGGIGGIRFVRSRLGLVLEGSSGQQFVAFGEGGFQSEAFAQRISRGSVLFRFGPKRPTDKSVELLAGPTLVFAQTSGVTITKLATAPIGGRHLFDEHQTAGALTGGVNLVLPVSSRWAFYFPIRANWLLKSQPRMPVRFDVQAGLGLSLRISQSVR